MVINWQIRELMRINHNIITIELLIKLIMSVHTHYGLSWRSIPVSGDIEETWGGSGLVWMREHLFSSSMVSSPGFSFLGPSRPDLVMHRLDGVDLVFGVDMQFLWFLWVVWLAGCWCRMVWHLWWVTLMPIPKNRNKPKNPNFE